MRQLAASATPMLIDGDVRSAYGDAHRTIMEAFTIAQAAMRYRNREQTPFTAKKLSQLLDGAPSARRDANPRGRNIQFELYMAALFALLRLDVRAGEPDFRFLFDHEYVGVAAKRTSSLNANTVCARLRKAADQIARHCRRGFIALNLDLLCSDMQSGGEIDRLLTDFEERVKIIRGALPELDGRPEVLGVIACGYVEQWVLTDGVPRIWCDYPIAWLRTTTDERERELVGRLFEGIGGRMQGVLAVL